MNKKRIINFVGNLLILAAIVGIILTFGPAAKEEASYQIKQLPENPVTQKVIKKKDLTPGNTDFWITIPKIEASAPVFANIDSQSEEEFLPVLYKGVAHAKNTSLPGEDGNAYIFAHSTDAFYNVGHYNAVFYLLGKLEKGDDVMIHHQGMEYLYKVREKRVVEPEEVEYLGDLGGKTLTLQTCYPPGTTLKRLVAIADQVEN